MRSFVSSTNSHIVLTVPTSTPPVSHSYATAEVQLKHLASSPPEPRLRPSHWKQSHPDTQPDIDNMDLSNNTPAAFLSAVPISNALSISRKNFFNSSLPNSYSSVSHLPVTSPSLTPLPAVMAPMAQQKQASPHRNMKKDFHGIPNPSPDEKLTLNDLRERLIRQEETIIFALIERAQFSLNEIIYQVGAFPDLPSYPSSPESTDSSPTLPVSFSQYMLYELERVHSTVRRYTSPDEHSFAPPHLLLSPVLSKLSYPETLVPNDINRNSEIEAIYQSSILPSICANEDDQNYGSSATCDAACLSALSKRIHYGKFIAEAKCQGDEDTYRRLAEAKDKEGIWDLLTNMKVENVLLKRVENKARNYGSEVTNDGPRNEGFKVEPKVISNLYRDFIIPLTKEVEVDYILHRYNVN